MTWSYSGDPATSAVDECRFIISDTDATAPIMQDEEIQYIIDTAGDNENRLRYLLFSHAATVYARDTKVSVGPMSEDPTERTRFFKDEAAKYKAMLNRTGLSLPVYAHEKIFSVGMNDNPPHTIVGGRYVP